MALEHAPKERRGFAASFANMGGPAGAVLATLAVSAVSLLPNEQFLAWGWRIPFILSIALVGIGLVIRLKVTESPLFLSLEQKAEERKTPIREVLTRYPKSVVRGTLVGMSSYTVQGLMTVWAISFVVDDLGMDRTSVLNIKAIGAALTVVGIWFAARYSDKYGRRPVMMVGILAGALLALPIMFMLELGSCGSSPLPCSSPTALSRPASSDPSAHSPPSCSRPASATPEPRWSTSSPPPWAPASPR